MKTNHKQIDGLDVTIISATREPKGAVILCHGFGADRSDLSSLASEMMDSDPRFKRLVFLFPDGPEVVDDMIGSLARAWWMIDFDQLERLFESGDFEELKSSSPVTLPQRSRQITGLIDYVEKKYRLARSKIVVGGFSQGAMLATNVALSVDRPVGGLIVWSGTLICQDRWRSLAATRKFPVYQSHGTMDEVLPFSEAVELCQLFVDAGLDCTFTEFDGPHAIDVSALQGAMKLIRKVCF